MPKYFLGIDNGLSGGLALLRDDRAIIWTKVMPVVTLSKKSGGKRREVDINGLLMLLNQLEKQAAEPVNFSDCTVILEQAQAMPGQGVVSMFSTGYGYGVVRALLTVTKAHVVLVNPRVWQKAVCSGSKSTDDPKSRALMAAKSLWPQYDFRASDKCKKAHDGLVDSVLIAEYGRRLDGVLFQPVKEASE